MLRGRVLHSPAPKMNNEGKNRGDLLIESPLLYCILLIVIIFPLYFSLTIFLRIVILLRTNYQTIYVLEVYVYE